MDIVKELQELRQSVADAVEDGRISIREAIRILREAADVAAIVLPLVLGKTTEAESAAANEELRQN